MDPLSLLPPPETVWGVFVRLLGVVYLIAFGSLWGQVLAVAGSRGTTPVARALAAVRRDHPSWRRFVHQPTLLWLSSSDVMLRALVGAGLLGAAAVVAGGPWTPWALLACWVCWVSLDAAMDLLYPWDCLLSEAGLLAVFLPATQLLPQVAAVAAPAPVLVFAYQLLLARLLVGFGKIKFVGATRQDRGYLREFLINQPMPNKVAWLAHRAPSAVLGAGLAVLFVAELVLPFLAFLPGWPRLVAAAGIVLLMAGIQLTSNFGYFNVLTMVLCVTLLDARTTLLDVSGADLAAMPLAHAFVAGWALMGLVHFPFNSWCTRSWPHWPFWENVRNRAVRAVVAAARALAPFRVVHSYGVFPPQTIPGVKFVPLIEATRDGVTWHEYHYRFYPCAETSPPRFVAPHHPRWDHYVLYDGLGHHPAGFSASLIALPNPYHFHPWGPMDRLLQRLLEGTLESRVFFRHDPFADGGGPPVRARVTLHMLEPTTPAERRATGRWWRRTRIAEQYPERGRQDERWAGWPGDPLLFHWDNVAHKRATPLLRDFVAAARRAETPEAMEAAAAAALAALGRPPEAVGRFWTDFLPVAGAPSGEDWETLPAAVAHVRERFSEAEVRDFERAAHLLAMGLAERYDRRVFGDPADYFPFPSYFHVGALFHAVLLEGREAFARALADDAWTMERARALHPARGLWLWGVFRHDMMLFHARRGRFVCAVAPADYKPGLPGFMKLAEWVATQLWDPREEALPLFTRDVADGRWRLSGWEGAARPPEPRKVAVPAIFGMAEGAGTGGGE